MTTRRTSPIASNASGTANAGVTVSALISMWQIPRAWQVAVAQLGLAAGHRYLYTADEHRLPPGGQLERVGIPDHQVGNLADRDGADIIEPQHARRVDGDRGQRRIPRQAACDGVAGRLAQVARVVRIGGCKHDSDARRMQARRVLT